MGGFGGLGGLGGWPASAGWPPTSMHSTTAAATAARRTAMRPLRPSMIAPSGVLSSQGAVCASCRGRCRLMPSIARVRAPARTPWPPTTCRAQARGADPSPALAPLAGASGGATGRWPSIVAASSARSASMRSSAASRRVVELLDLVVDAGAAAQAVLDRLRRLGRRVLAHLVGVLVGLRAHDVARRPRPACAARRCRPRPGAAAPRPPARRRAGRAWSTCPRARACA